MDTQHLPRPDGTIAYDDSGGEGELVLMLPGLGDLRQEYRFLVPPLTANGYRTVTADLRGHGESSAGWPEYSITAVGQDILALIDHLDAGPVHLIATSFSPGAAVWAAAERPQAFRSLTLIGAFVRDTQPGLIQRLLQSVMVHGPWKVAAWGMFYKTLYPTRKPADLDAYVEYLKTMLREPGRYDALKGLAYAPKGASEERLGQVTASSLVIMGTKDPDWPDPVAEARYIAGALHAELALIEGAGHYPHAEMPEQVAPIILAFLQQSSAAAPLPPGVTQEPA